MDGQAARRTDGCRINGRVVWTHSLDAVLVDPHAAVQRFKGLAEREGEEADGAELQAVSHFLQHLRRLLLDDLARLAALRRNLRRTGLGFSFFF